MSPERDRHLEFRDYVERERHLELRDYLRVLRQRKLTVFFVAVVCVAASLAISLLQTPSYVASSKLLVQPRTSDLLFEAGQRVNMSAAVATEIEVVRSAAVQALVQEKLGMAPAISASAIGETNVIEIRARSDKRKVAADVANAYANAYIEFRRKQVVDNLLAASQEIQARIADLQGQIDALDRRVNEAPPQIRNDAARSVADEKQALVQQQGAFKERIAQAQVDTALATGQAQVVKAATTPTSPVSPKPVANAVLGLIVGLALGGGLAFLLDHLDDSVKDKEDIDRMAPDVPTLGVIPAIRNRRSKDGAQVISLADPRSPASESFRTLRTSLQFLTLEREVRLLQVTSPGVGEGKSTIVANLGVALASVGRRVVIVDCDLRKPRLHKFFGLDNSQGVTSVLLGTVPLTRALRKVADVPNLSLIPSGEIPPTPAELLSSARMTEVLTAAQAHADIVLVDSPPILPVTDAVIISGKVDGMLLACRGGVTRKREFARALELLHQVDAPVLGTIFNGASDSAGYAGAYYYQYRYSEDSERSRRIGVRQNGKNGARPASDPSIGSRRP